MAKIFACLLMLFPFMVQAQEEPRQDKLIHISEETKQMIFYRSLQMDGCLSRMKYHLMYDEIDDDMRARLIHEIDYMWYMLGINPLKTN